MNNKYNKGFLPMFLASLISLGCVSIVHGKEKAIEIQKEYRTAMKDEDGTTRFKEIYEKDGMFYRLKSVKVDHVEEIVPGDTITYESAPFVGSWKESELQETIEKNGKKYKLKESGLIKTVTAETATYSEASIQYKGVEYIDSLPEEAEVKVVNEDLKQELKVRLPAVDYKEERTYWDYSFTFPITVTGYDADSYMLGQTEISNLSPFTDHVDQFLDYLNLPPQYYEITRIQWDGEPVQKDGEIIRRATAYGRKLVKDICGTYGGEVVFPAIRANVYRGIYMEADAENQTNQIIYHKHATGFYEQQDRIGLRNFLKLMFSKTITFAIFTILLLIFLIIVIKRTKKKKRYIP